MDVVVEIGSNEKILFTEGTSSYKSTLPEPLLNNCTFSNCSSLTGLTDKFDTVISMNVNAPTPYNSSVLTNYLKLLKPGGRFVHYQIIMKSEQKEDLKKNLLISGFVNTEVKTAKKFSFTYNSTVIQQDFHGCSGKEILYIYSEKPHYEVGSFKTLTLPISRSDMNDVAAVWKLDNDDNDNDDYINADDLLDEDDLKKPEPSSLKVCGTTGKRKACKGCTCGLAEELEQETNQNKDTKDTANAKSSCGNCYLGDAFRCASCPYLGMPAFQPGEKVRLSDQFLSPDI